MALPLLLGGLQAGAGLVQSLIGGSQARKARRALEALEVPKTTSSASISDYYNRAQADPYDTAMFRSQKQNIDRGVSTGISQLQSRGGALAGIQSILRGANDATLRAASVAEQQQRQMLGDAVRLKTADDQRVFNINELMPFERKSSILASKAAGGNQVMNAGLSNIFGGFGTMSMGVGGGDSFGIGSGSGADVGMDPSNYWRRLSGDPLRYKSPASTFSVSGRKLPGA